ncbi:MAG TPA: hypothetical protein DCX32_03905 [Candidatus Moranbacteria bacterium]|nr:hypothetical protein [Candidatus Moranbacteria bacterium]
MPMEHAALSEMPDEKLIKLFFSNGGEIFLKNFNVPADKNGKARQAFDIMRTRHSCMEMLRNIQEEYLKGKVDRSGRRIKRSQK